MNVLGTTSPAFRGEDQSLHANLGDIHSIQTLFKARLLDKITKKEKYKRVHAQRLSPRLPRMQGYEGKPDEETEKQQPVKKRKEERVSYFDSQVKEIFPKGKKCLIMLSITVTPNKLTKN